MKEDADGVFAPVADLVAVNLHVVAPLRGDDACWRGAVATHGFPHETNRTGGRQDGRHAARVWVATGKDGTVLSERSKNTWYWWWWWLWWVCAVCVKASTRFSTLPRQHCHTTYCRNEAEEGPLLAPRTAAGGSQTADFARPRAKGSAKHHVVADKVLQLALTHQSAHVCMYIDWRV